MLLLGSATTAGAAVHRAIHLRRRRRREELIRVWSNTAQRLGLHFEAAGTLRIYGTIGSISIRVETSQEGSNGALCDVTRFQLEDAARIPLTFRMRRRARTGWLVEEVEKNGISTGDPFLDALAVVRGNEVRLAAVLQQKTRELVKLAIGIHGAAIGYGRVTHSELGHIRSERRLIGVLHMLRDLIEALAIDEARIPSALYRNIFDPIEGVRRRNYQLLFEWFPDSSEARLALPRAASDPDPVIRLTGALGRGVDGLSEIVAAIEDPSVAVAIKLYAIRQLALRYRGAIVERTLRNQLESPFTSVVSATLRAIAASRKRELMGDVLDLIRDPTCSHEIVVEAISALGALGDASIERDLIALLHHSGLHVRLTAAYALGSIGTLASIEHLLECAAGLFTHRALKETARRSIRRIQERFFAAGAGLLSLVEGEGAGDLSLVGNSDGALSFD